MLSNFISGILIFIYEPFKIGDVIKVEGKEGKVTSINLRYVAIESGKEEILVPNSISVSKIVSVTK
jgi:small conductance mechanosensitive channel